MDTIPIYINNFNRLASVKEMVSYLLSVRGVKPIIIDNASTYPPLLAWYNNCPVSVVRFQTNHGPRALWGAGIDLTRSNFFGLTDPDLDLSQIPRDWPQVLCRGLDAHEDVTKAGFSLEIADLPDTTVGKQAREYEAGYWTVRRDDSFFLAPIDTTFALYRGAKPAWSYGPALRADRPYTARHLPWYLEPGGATDEDLFYWQHAIPGVSYWGTRLEQVESSH